MPITKKIKDYCLKLAFGHTVVPRGLFDISHYFRIYGAIEFQFNKEEKSIIAVSKNFRYGSIVTSGKDLIELDKNIKDAILTAFEVPSSYAKEANIHSLRERREQYALA